MPGFPLPMMYYPDGTPEPPTPVLSWYDPSDLATLFQDSAMTIPVTTDGQSVQAVADKGTGNNDVIYTSGGSALTYETDASMGHWLAFTQRFLEKTAFNGLNGDSQVTIVNAWELDSATGALPSPFEIVDSGTIQQFLPSYLVTTAERDVYYPAASSIPQDTSNTPFFGVFVIEVLIFDGTQPAQADRMLIVQNSKEQTNDTLASIAATVSANPLTLRLFGRSNTNYTNGRWWGTLIYDRLLTAPELEDVISYYYAQRVMEAQNLPDPTDWYQFGLTEGNASVSGGPNPYSVTNPGDIVQGDFILRLKVNVSGSNESATNVPWIAIGGFSSGATSLSMSLLYRQASAAEPGTYTFTKSNSNVQMTMLARIRGGVLKNSTATNASTSSNSGNSVVIASMTPVLMSEGLLLFGIQWINTVSVVTPPSGMTLVMDEIVPTIPNASRLQVYAEELVSGAPTAIKTLTLSGNTQYMAMGAVLS